MNELLITLGGLISSLGNVQSSAVLRERLALAQDKFQQVNELVTQLQNENARLRQDLHNAKQEVSANLEAAKFTEHEGAFFKRKPSGGYHHAVYCPNCHFSTAPFPPGAEYNCMKCGWFSSFKASDLDKIINEIAT